MRLVLSDDWLTVHGGDNREVMRTLPDESVQCVVTSPPYWGLRSYGIGRENGELGLEQTPDEYVAAMVDVFREVRRVLRRDGTLWLNLGDSYASGPTTTAEAAGVRSGGTLNGRRGHADRVAMAQQRAPVPAGLKPKDLVGIPWRVAFALQQDGWYLRSDIIWAKPNPMPESVTDRPTKAHEYLFLLSRSERYVYDADAIAEDAVGRTEHDLTGPGYFAPVQTRQRGTRRDTFERSGPVSEHIIPGQSAAQHRPRKQDAGQQASGGDRMTGFNDRYAAEPRATMRNRRSVWTIATKPYPGAHFATFPEALVEPCILAGAPEGSVVLDPFAGTGTVGLVAQRLSRRAVLIDLNPDYLRQCIERNRQQPLGLSA